MGISQKLGNDSPLKTNREMTWVFNFQDINLAQKYKRFKIASASPYTIFFLSIILSFFFLIYWSLVLFQNFITFSIISFLISFFISFLPLITLAYLRMKIPIKEQLEKHFSFFLFLENLVLYGWTIGLSLIFYLRISNGQCHEENLNFFKIWNCMPTLNCKSLPVDTTFLLIVIPLLFSPILPFLEMSSIICSQCLAIASIICGIVISNAWISSSWVAFAIFFTLTAHVFNRLQHMELFLYTDRFEHSLELRARDHKEYAERVFEEMQSMISCIAHDLKSVSNQTLDLSLLFL